MKKSTMRSITPEKCPLHTYGTGSCALCDNTLTHMYDDDVLFDETLSPREELYLVIDVEQVRLLQRIGSALEKLARARANDGDQE